MFVRGSANGQCSIFFDLCDGAAVSQSNLPGFINRIVTGQSYFIYQIIIQCLSIRQLREEPVQGRCRLSKLSYRAVHQCQGIIGTFHIDCKIDIVMVIHERRV